MDMHSEARLTRLEQRMLHIEVVTDRKLDALVNDYQTISVAFEKLVTRKEFSPIQFIVYGSACAVFGGLALFFLFTMLAR